MNHSFPANLTLRHCLGPSAALPISRLPSRWLRRTCPPRLCAPPSKTRFLYTVFCTGKVSLESPHYEPLVRRWPRRLAKYRIHPRPLVNRARARTETKGGTIFIRFAVDVCELWLKRVLIESPIVDFQAEPISASAHGEISNPPSPLGGQVMLSYTRGQNKE